MNDLGIAPTEVAARGERGKSIAQFAIIAKKPLRRTDFCHSCECCDGLQNPIRDVFVRESCTPGWVRRRVQVARDMSLKGRSRARLPR